MNACLTKPFEEAELVRLIDTLAGTVRPLSAPEPAASGPAAEPLAQLSTESPTAPVSYPATLMRVGRGDPRFAHRVVTAFCATGATALTALREAARTNDATAAGDIAHRLVPSARLLDAEELADTLAEIERLPATDPSWPDALAFAGQELEALLARLAGLLKA